MTRVEATYEAVLQAGTVLIRPTGYRGCTSDGSVAGLLAGKHSAMRPFVAGVLPDASLVPGKGEPIESLQPYVWFPYDTWAEIVEATYWRPQVPQTFNLKSPFSGKYLYEPNVTKTSRKLKFMVNGKATEITLPRRAELLIEAEEDVRCGDYFAEVVLPEETVINRHKHSRDEYKRLLREQQGRMFTRSQQVAKTYMKYVLPELHEDGVVLPAGQDSILPALLASMPSRLRDEDAIPAGCGPYECEDRGPLLRLLGQGRILWNISNPQRFATQVSLARLRTERSGVGLEVLTMPWSWCR